ncbi:MAG: replication-associated recombination protein A [Dehalococcoidales bacterium]|nr:replication-associated recombination protein A [Dehalococcoidales bacterium]
MADGGKMQDMFTARADGLKQENAPLAAKMRPQNFDEFVGQEHIIRKGRALRQSIEADKLPSVILWGPPGSGKTTLARIIASSTRSFFAPISAVSAGVGDLRKVAREATERLGLSSQRTILFIDEIHRFNKAQQDAVLPYVEDGTLTLIGATTENPSFEVVSPLLSRCQVIILRPLDDGQLRIIFNRAIRDEERGLGKLNLEVDDDALDFLVMLADHDARQGLNFLEIAANAASPDKQNKRKITLSLLEEVIGSRALKYDKSGDAHYDAIYDLHKTLRGSDPDAGLYWLGRMLEAGEDPLYIARRLIRFATEDVGLADAHDLVIAMAAQQAVHCVGMPEAELALAELVVYLAAAPKSNALYTAFNRVREDIKKSSAEPVPLHLRNAPTKLMKEIGYGKGYKYAHDHEGHFVRQQNLPDSIKNRRYYYPGTEGFEGEIMKRLQSWWPERFAEIKKKP